MPVSSGALPISAAALGVLAGALVLLRLLPPGTSLALRLALRSRRPLAVFGAARAAVTSRRALAWLVLAVPAGLAAFALTLGATAERGLVDGAWQTVGADARLDVTRDPAVTTPDLVRRLSGAPGVEQIVAGQVTDGARLSTGPDILVARLVVVSAVEYARLLAATPPHLALPELAGPAAGGVPALVRLHSTSVQPGLRLDLLRDRAPAMPLVAVGPAPTVGDAEDVVIVDSATIAAAGMTVVPNTVWVTGPGTGAALTARTGELLSTGAARPVLREDVLRARQGAPLSAWLLRLAWVGAGTLLALALLGLALGATASAPERWQTLTRLRTLGLRARDIHWVAAGELLPPVLLAAIGGPLLGLLLARLSLGPLALRLLTGQPDDPVLVPPWWWLGLIALGLLAAVAVVVPLEAARRRRLLLGEVLRAG
jgi:putative ABC transport system permease protein